VNRFNEHEIPAAENIAREMKIMLDVRPMGLSDDVPDVELEGTIQERKKQWLPKNEKYISDSYKGEYRYPLSPGICTQLFTRVVVAVDGKILPCCEVWDKESAFGDLMTETFEAIWYGRKYMDARRRFLQKDYHPENLTVCSRCHNYSATHSFGDKLRLALTVFRKNISHCR
jgi:radical SAM protein with 4Fe4S-binding SPASM domain